jgi:hypothetical protein
MPIDFHDGQMPETGALQSEGLTASAGAQLDRCKANACMQ